MTGSLSASGSIAVVGMDQSLVSFGLAQVGLGEVVLHRIRPKTRGHERLAILLDSAFDLAVGADLVAIEGLSMNSVSTSGFDRAGLYWLLLHGMWERKIPYVVIPPAIRAFWITGKGNAGKDECLAAAIYRFGHLAEIKGNDQADALTIAALTVDAYGQPLVKMPADRTERLHGKNRKSGQPSIDWPQL